MSRWTRVSVVLTSVATAGLVAIAGLREMRPASLPQSVAAMPSAFKLNYDVAGNLGFAIDVVAALRTVQRSMAGELCLPLIADEPILLTPVACPAAEPGQRAIVTVAVLRDGVVARLYASHSETFERPLPLGSLSKAVVGVPLLAHAGARADERWCEQAYGGFRNSDGFQGVANCDRVAGVPAPWALARSNNLATLWRLRRIAEAETRKVLNQAGVGNVGADYLPAVGVALGIVELSPRQALECLDALASGIAVRAAIVEDAIAPPTHLALWCAAAVSTPARRSFVETMLSAPRRRGGTAEFASALLPRGTKLLIKTGTPSNAERMDTGKALLGSFLSGGVRHTFLIAVLSPNPAAPLGRRLAGSHLAPVLEVIADDANASAPQRVSSRLLRRDKP